MAEAVRAATPSIQRRVLGSALAGIIAGALLSAAAAALAVSTMVEALTRSALEEVAQVLITLAESEGALDALRLAKEMPPHREHLQWQLRATDGTVIGRSHEAPVASWQVPLVPGYRRADGVAAFTLGGKRFWLQVAHPLADLRRAQRAAALQVGGAVLGFSLIAAGAVAWRIRRELRPLAQLAREVASVAPGPVAPPLPRSPRRELEPVYAALEELLSRLARQLRSEHAFASHAAHSLRTPLAGLSAQLEVARLNAPEALAERLTLALESAQRLGRVVDSLLTMARAGATPDIREFSARDLAPVAIGGRMQVDFEPPPTAETLRADPDLFAVAVSNLIDNAARHGARRARVTVHVSHGMQRIVVADDGTPPSPERMQALRAALDTLERNGQVEPALGLGLTLAASVARAHGGHLEIGSGQPPLGGFCAQLVWPRHYRATLPACSVRCPAPRVWPHRQEPGHRGALRFLDHLG